MTTRLAREEDRSAVRTLLSAVENMPDAARAAALTAFDDAVAGRGERRCVVAVEGEGPGEAALGFACFVPVPMALAAVDMEWVVVRKGLRARDLVERLVAGVAEAASPGAPVTVRFQGGHWQRGGADPHLLDAAGMERIGGIDGFFGPDDPLIVFVARRGRTRDVEFDPTSPAALFDAAFSFRDFAFERNFLLACAERFGARPVRRAASWACGTGRHLLAFADLGVEGVGIDETPELLALGAALREARGAAPITWIEGALDARPDAPKVDLSFCMLSAVHRAASETAIVAHLDAAAALLAPGGIHVIEATLPVDATPEGNTQTIWTERRGNYVIASRFRIAAEQRAKDGTVQTFLDVRCRRHDEPGTVGALQQQERWLVPTAAQWRALVERSQSFQIGALLGDFHLDVAWDQPGAWRIVVVLRRV
jgi:hypothetical protein